MRSAVLCIPHKLEVESCLNGKHFWRERVISTVAALPAPPLFPQMCSPHKNSTPSSLNEYEVLPNGCEAHWEVVERILFIYAKLNPGIAYVQGMNEIVGPLYYTFATDPNSEWKGKRPLGCPHPSCGSLERGAQESLANGPREALRLAPHLWASSSLCQR